MSATTGSGESAGAARDLAIPASAFTYLRQALRKEAGPLKATHALHDAGFATGESVFQEFARITRQDPSELDEARFWEALSRFFQGRGWGRVEHQRLHPGLGVIRARGWAECAEDGGEHQPGCHFTAGLLAHMLGRVAQGPVAVLEVSCASTGGEHCDFLFGSEGAIHEVYGHLLNGQDLESVLQSL